MDRLLKGYCVLRQQIFFFIKNYLILKSKSEMIMFRVETSVLVGS